MNNMTGFSISTKDYKKEYEEFRALNIVERLRQRAKGLRNQADQFNGCSWIGNRHPSSYYLDEARDLEEAATIIEDYFKGKSYA